MLPVASLNRKRSREQEEDAPRSARPRLTGWTSIAEAASLPFKLLVESGLVTRSERIAHLKNLIPDTEDGLLPHGKDKDWSAGFLGELIQRVTDLGKACGLIGQMKDFGRPSEFSPVTEQLIDAYKKCVAKILNSPSPHSLNLLLKQQIHPDNILQRLNHFFLERSHLLENPEIQAAAKHFILDAWQAHLKHLRPLPKLFKELQAGQELLRRLAPKELSDPFIVQFVDQEELELGDPELDVLAEASEAFKAMFEGNLREAANHRANLDITYEEYHLLMKWIEGEPISFETCPTLLIVADKYLIPTLAHECLEGLKDWIRRVGKRKDRIQLLDQMGQVDKKLRGRLGPINQEAWSKIRDETISRSLSNAFDNRVCSKLVKEIIKNQEAAITWPTSLSLKHGVMPALLQLTALEHLVISGYQGPNLSSKIVNLAEKIGSFPLLKTLKGYLIPLELAQMDDEACLANLQNLTSLELNFIDHPQDYRKFCLHLGKLSALETLRLKLPVPVLPDVSSMPSLQNFEVLTRVSLPHCGSHFTNSHYAHLYASSVVLRDADIFSLTDNFSLNVDRVKKCMSVAFVDEKKTP